MSAIEEAYHLKSIYSSQNQEYLAILATFYQAVKKKREWLRLYLVHFRKKNKCFELLEDQPVYHLKTKSF